MKKLLSILLALTMLVSLVPAGYAEEIVIVGDDELITVVEPELPEEIPLADGSELDVTQYSYEIEPVLAPFAYILYVKTNNPDPGSFRLVDRESKYYTEGDHSEIRIPLGSSAYSSYSIDPGTYYINQSIYADVAYEDTETWRVSGGYLFITRSAYGDGGDFVLQQKLPGGSSITNWKYQDTEVTVPCGELKLGYDYLIDTYTDESMSFFENLDSVQHALDQIAVYPRSLFDSSQPNTARPYPLLATSPYAELSLNEHYDAMFARHGAGLLASAAYPFVLDSLGFPGMIGTVAKILEPDCEVKSGGYHYLVTVTLGEESRSYGGAGSGGNDPLFSSRVTPQFCFDGSGALDRGDVAAFCANLLSYEPIAAADIAAYRDLIQGDTFRATIAASGGTWIRVATEGFGFGLTFSYVVPRGNGYVIASNAWVDGHYINRNEQITMGKTFDEYPTASVIKQKMSYVDYYGKEHCQDVIYTYESSTDDWRAKYFYSDSNGYYSSMGLPDEFILSREQVEELVNSPNANRLPSSGLVYDGTEYPGTPFTLNNVTGVSLPEELTMRVDDRQTISVTVEPEDAFDGRVTWRSSDPEIVAVSSSSAASATSLIAKSIGSATITATAVDGGATASCRVTVLKKHIEGDLNDDDVADAADAEILMRYLTGLGDVDGIPTEFLDLNGDGLVNNFDARRLYRLAENYGSGSTTPYSEAGSITVKVEQIRAKAGDTGVHVRVLLPDNPGIASMKLNISYDKAALRLNEETDFGSGIKGMSNSRMMGNWMTDGFDPDADPLIANWILVGGNYYNTNQPFLDLVFDILPDAACGQHPITISADWDDVFNSTEYFITPALESGWITVEHRYGEPTWTWTEDPVTATATFLCICGDEQTADGRIAKETIDGDCTKEGKIIYTATAYFNGAEYTDTREETLSLGDHDWDEPSYEWAEDYSTATATHVCKLDPSHVESETVETLSWISKGETCEEMGETTYAAYFTTPEFETQTVTLTNIPAKGHDWAAPSYVWAEDNSTVTATRSCRRNSSHVETETVSTTSEVTTPASCEADGLRTYTATFTNPVFAAQTKTEVIPAMGHTPGEPVRENEVAATCESEGGYDTVVYCTVCGRELSREHTTIPATGHDWEAPTYVWADDNSTVTATRVCKNGDHPETETANTSYEVITEPTTEADGLGRYTAVFENPAFTTQTKDVPIEKLPVVGFTVAVDTRYVTSGNGDALAWTDLDPDARYHDEVEFTVGSKDDLAVLVAVKNGDGSYTVLPCTDADGCHCFTLNVTEDTALVLALKGDVDFNGKVALKDNLMVKKHIAKSEQITDSLALLVADTDGSGEVKLRDNLMIKKQISKSQMIEW